ncbi:inositol monophosphatase family protein [Hyphomonas sp. WL0036]|uniref:inositol monophosphatase family protein n=1 Tax=Hyphomonas sediminis TaxID=2866160 RepID=UPI001C81DA61|nr:inositol monophosphatase family protein [Hyphomonas sediminis]MBY9065791.1 inositol monophosphatase family protein [Hyphomonas sediminis]
MTSQRDFASDIALARRLADAAWSAIRPHFRNLAEIDHKSGNGNAGFDPVTEADRAAELAMRAIIAAERPNDGVTGEEFPDTDSASGWRWYFDPIDGTRAFVAGLPVWTTLIALVDPDGHPVMGVIDQPVLGERYIGGPDGSVLETPAGSSPICVSGNPDLRTATISTTDPFILTPPEQGAWNHLRSAARITRYGLDAYAYARLAGGTLDLVAESCLKAWDVAALIPVVRGAGGLATNWRGEAPALSGQIVCAASEGILEQALLALRRAAD